MACHLLSLPKGPLPGCRRRNKPPVQIPAIHLPLFEKPVYFPYTHHQPFPDSKARYPVSP